MAVDPATTIPAFDTTLPTSSDFVSEGDDNFRHVKSVLKTTFPNLGGAWNATPTEANYIVGVTSSIQTQLNAKGAIAGQTWTGTHVFPSTTTVGSVTPTIFGYLVNLTSDAQAQITARAIKAGDTYSGTHNFTGATVNVPTLVAGSTGNGAASVDYANALSFASALPGQTGNSGKFVTTDGTSASWSLVPFSSVSSKPNTLSGYGITDGVATSGNQTVAGNKSFTGDVLQTGSGVLGFGAGSGGTVTQLTSKSTAVTLNKMSGKIIMNSAALAGDSSAAFYLQNTYIAAGDQVLVSLFGGGSLVDNYSVRSGSATNAARIVLKNETSGTLSDAVELYFSILKGAAS